MLNPAGFAIIKPVSRCGRLRSEAVELRRRTWAGPQGHTTQRKADSGARAFPPRSPEEFDMKLLIQNGRVLDPVSSLLVEHEKKKPQKATVTGGKSMARMMNIKPEINVLGMTVDEATSLVDRFLDDALMAHLHRVTIIHGKGTGALRKGIHQFLKSQPHVKSFRLGEFGEGDAGVTIVEL